MGNTKDRMEESAGAQITISLSGDKRKSACAITAVCTQSRNLILLRFLLGQVVPNLQAQPLTAIDLIMAGAHPIRASALRRARAVYRFRPASQAPSTSSISVQP